VLCAIPDWSPPPLRLGPLVVTAFDLLVVAAVVVGFSLTVRRAARAGWPRERAERLTLWMLLAGGVGSHLFAVLAYRPQLVREDPLLLLRVWGAMSSFGGIAGGLLGGLWAARAMGVTRGEAWRYFDGVAFAFPFAWIFGRAGCALAHDHLGIASQSFLAVQFPSGPRFDLGLLELLYTLLLAALFLWLDRRPRPSGFYIGLFFALYGPVRFGLDQLRTGDLRYAGWTPGQYASLAATLLGAGLLFSLSRDGRAREVPRDSTT